MQDPISFTGAVSEIISDNPTLPWDYLYYPLLRIIEVNNLEIGLARFGKARDRVLAARKS